MSPNKTGLCYNRRYMNKFLIVVIFILVVGWVIYDNKNSLTKTETIVPVATTTKPVVVDGKKDLIIVSSPVSNQVLSSPFVISGKARGQWFFEASFPIELRDMQGNIIETIIAQAQGEWMTTEFVPFTASLIFTKPKTPMQAVLVFKRDNPSGLPENDDSVEIPITIQ